MIFKNFFTIKSVAQKKNIVYNVKAFVTIDDECLYYIGFPDIYTR